MKEVARQAFGQQLDRFRSGFSRCLLLWRMGVCNTNLMNRAHLWLARLTLAGVAFAMLLLTSCSTAKSTAQARPVVSSNTNLVLEPGFQAGEAVVRNILGKGSYSSDGTHWEKLKIKMVIKPGSIVRTGKDTIVDLFLGVNGPVVRIGDNSTLCLDQLAFNKDGENVIIKTRLTVAEGVILGNVKQLATHSDYEIVTAAGTAKIAAAESSTEFQICQCGRVLVLVGTMVLATGNERFTVGAGEEFDPNTKKMEKVPMKIEKVIRYGEMVNQYGEIPRYSDLCK